MELSEYSNTIDAGNVVPYVAAAIGTYGIREMVRGGYCYAEEDFSGGSDHILRANVALLTGAVARESFSEGFPGEYSLTEVPFFIGALREVIIHKQIGPQWLKDLAKSYNAAYALGLNALVHAGQIFSEDVPLDISDWLKHIGFVGLSTALVMPASQESGFSNLSKLNERLIAVATTRSLLVAGLAVVAYESIGNVAQSGELSDFNILAFIWLMLNAFGLIGDCGAFRKSLQGNRQKTQKILAEESIEE